MVCVGFQGHSGGANVGITATRKQTADRTDVGITATPSNKHRRVLGNPQQKRWEEPQRTRRPSDELPDSDHELERIVVHVRVLLAPLAVAHAPSPELVAHVVDFNLPAQLFQGDSKKLSTSDGLVLPSAADRDDIQVDLSHWVAHALPPQPSAPLPYCC